MNLNIKLKSICLTVLAFLLCSTTGLQASSHREAPLIADDPLADNTDVYAFRSPDDTNTITIIANYIPAQLPHGGPNYYHFGENIHYEIHIDNDISTAGDDIIYRFTFTRTNEDPTTFFNIRLGAENLKTTYTVERSMDGGSSWTTIVTNGEVPAYNIGPRSIESMVGLNTTYDAEFASGIMTASTGEMIFAGPVDDPFFVDLGAAFDLGDIPRNEGTNGGEPRDGLACYNVHSIAIKVPISTLQKNGMGVTSASNILDGDFVIGVWASASRKMLRTLNTDGSQSYSGSWVQVSRLGMPLTNEVIIPIGEKDEWNARTPYNEKASHNEYFYNPELGLYIEPGAFAGAVPAFGQLHIQDNSLQMFDFSNGADGLYPLKGSSAVAGTALDDALYGNLLLPGPGKPRSVDLWPLFHTGVPNVIPYQLATGKDVGNPLDTGKPFVNNFLPNGGDMLRLNMAVPVTPRNDPDFSSLGLVQAAVLGLTDSRFNTDRSLEFIPNMDGFPNGRRLEDDVTRIEIQAVSGIALAAIGLFYDDYEPGVTPSPVTPELLDVYTYTTGVEENDTSFRTSFPYVQQPWRGTGKCSGKPTDFMAAAILPPTEFRCDAGMVLFADDSVTMDYICIDGNPDYRSFINTSETSADYAYIITNDQEEILSVIGPDDSVNFDNAGVGVCHIYGVSYTDTLHAMPGNDISTVTATGCYDVTDEYASIIRTNSDAEIMVSGNGMNILDGDSVPSMADGTDFGNVATGDNASQDFEIENNGTDTLFISHVMIVGPNADQFTVTQQPDDTLEASDMTTFTITYMPDHFGLHCATVEIFNSDCDEGRFVFNIVGTDTTATAAAVLDTLLANDAANDDKLGFSTAIDGDAAIAGAPLADPNGNASGAAYVYRMSGSDYMQEAKLMASDGAAGDKFGFDVDISGDYAIVGAPEENNNGFGTGKAYIYHHTGGTWVQMAMLTAPIRKAGDFYGYSVAISGNYAAVGALGADPVAPQSGAVFVYHLMGGTWNYVQELTQMDAMANDYFGLSVDLEGDRLIAGAPYKVVSGMTKAGAAYVFNLMSGSFMQEAKLMASDPATEDLFGWAVGVSGEQAVVGAYQDDDNGTNSGSAYIFHKDMMTWMQAQKLVPDQVDAGDYFGQAVAMDGDTVVVGAYRATVSGIMTGTAFVYTKTKHEFLLNKHLHSPSPNFLDDFGYSVDVHGDLAIAGAPNDDIAGNNTGAAYVFDLSQTAPMSPMLVRNSPNTALQSNTGNPAEALDAEMALAIGESASGLKVNMYPNPAASQVMVAFDRTQNEFTIEVLDGAGKLLHRTQNMNTISLQGISAGIYLVRVQTTDGVVMKRLVIQK